VGLSGCRGYLGASARHRRIWGWWHFQLSAALLSKGFVDVFRQIKLEKVTEIAKTGIILPRREAASDKIKINAPLWCFFIDFAP
jgi:hypothetical protein